MPCSTASCFPSDPLPPRHYFKSAISRPCLSTPLPPGHPAPDTRFGKELDGDNPIRSTSAPATAAHVSLDLSVVIALVMPYLPHCRVLQPAQYHPTNRPPHSAGRASVPSGATPPRPGRSSRGGSEGNDPCTRYRRPGLGPPSPSSRRNRLPGRDRRCTRRSSPRLRKAAAHQAHSEFRCSRPRLSGPLCPASLPDLAVVLNTERLSVPLSRVLGAAFGAVAQVGVRFVPPEGAAVLENDCLQIQQLITSSPSGLSSMSIVWPTSPAATSHSGPAGPLAFPGAASRPPRASARWGTFGAA